MESYQLAVGLLAPISAVASNIYVLILVQRYGVCRKSLLNSISCCFNFLGYVFKRRKVTKEIVLTEEAEQGVEIMVVEDDDLKNQRIILVKDDESSAGLPAEN